MRYKEKKALVSKINKDSITVFVPCETSEKCKACASYGVCGSAGSSISHTIPTDAPSQYSEKEQVDIKLAVPPFFISVFLVFVLPLLCMILFPAILYYGLGRTGGGEMETIGAGLAGLAAGFIPGRLIDRAFSKKHPASISKKTG